MAFEEDVNFDVIEKLEQFSEDISLKSNIDDQVKDRDNNNKKMTNFDANAEYLESEFCILYHQAIRKLINADKDDDNISQLLRFFRVYYAETTSWCILDKLAKNKDKDFKQLLTCSLFYRIAYIYRIGVVLSSAVAYHFQNILFENPKLSGELFRKRNNLKICSIGSGCAADVIGIIKVLEIVGKKMDADLKVFATIIDVDEGWKNTALVALMGLKQFRKSTWKINFIQANASCKKLSENVVKAIRDADIVTMVNTHDKGKRDVILKNVTEATRPGCLTLVLDRSRLNTIRRWGGQSGEIANQALVYEDLCQVYSLQESVVKQLFCLYHKMFPSYGCDRKLDIFVRAWITKSSEFSDKTPSIKNRYSLKPQLQNSLTTTNYFRNWEQKFSKEMANLGWNRKGTDNVINQHRDTRSRLLRLCNKGRLNLVNVPEDEEEEVEMDEDEWRDYYDTKKDLGMVRIGVCNVSIFNLKCNLKRNLLGPKVKNGNKKMKRPDIVWDDGVHRRKGSIMY